MIPSTNVTVVTYNRPELTFRCLTALREVTARPISLTVVDNGSEKPLRDELMRLRETGVIDKLYLNRRNMGVSVAANLGWAQTDADHYVKLDNDIIVQDPAWLDELAALAEEGGFAMSGYRLCAWHQTSPALLPSGRKFQATKAVGGGCVLIPRAAHAKLGFWNEDYLYGWEDLEYGNRAAQAGFNLAYAANDALVLHAGPPVDETLPEYRQTKQERTETTFGPQGLFHLNMAMFELGLRPLCVTRKFVPEVTGEGGLFEVKYRLDPAYAPITARQNLLREHLSVSENSTDVYLNLLKNGGKAE